jgi:hypothetical protein
MTRLAISWTRTRSTRTMPSASAPRPRPTASKVVARSAGALFAGLLAAAAALGQASRQLGDAPQSPAAQPAKGVQAPTGAARSGKTHRYQPDRFAGRAGSYYRLIWGVDDLIVRWGESGEVIRFSYRVLDANKAKALNDKKNEPSLIDPQAGVRLVVPTMENVGQLRQTAPPEGGKSYWIVFSNAGRLVKRGHHVNVVIGSFHADGLVVD